MGLPAGDLFLLGLENKHIFATETAYDASPSYLNFAFSGTLSLTFDNISHSFPNFRLGLGTEWTGHHNWWIGSADCIRTEYAFVCKSQEGLEVQLGVVAANGFFVAYH